MQFSFMLAISFNNSFFLNYAHVRWCTSVIKKEFFLGTKSSLTAEINITLNLRWEYFILGEEIWNYDNNFRELMSIDRTRAANKIAFWEFLCVWVWVEVCVWIIAQVVEVIKMKIRFLLNFALLFFGVKINLMKYLKIYKIQHQKSKNPQKSAKHSLISLCLF